MILVVDTRWGGEKEGAPFDWGRILKVFLGCLIIDKRSKPTDIFAIGFEEMVELNAGNIVNAR